MKGSLYIVALSTLAINTHVTTAFAPSASKQSITRLFSATAVNDEVHDVIADKNPKLTALFPSLSVPLEKLGFSTPTPIQSASATILRLGHTSGARTSMKEVALISKLPWFRRGLLPGRHGRSTLGDSGGAAADRSVGRTRHSIFLGIETKMKDSAKTGKKANNCIGSATDC